MKYKRRTKKSKKISIPRMGVVGGLTEAANNIKDEEAYKRTGVRPPVRKPYEGGAGKGIVNIINSIGRFFNPNQFRDIE
jgi:hypothetical protein